MLVLVLTALSLPAQNAGKRWQLHKLGAGYINGNVQFFDGFNHTMLLTDAQAGLPLYNDWLVYSGSSQLPDYYALALDGSLIDTTRNLELRLGLRYAYRKDSMNYSSSFALNDTVYGRDASETGSFFGVSAAGFIKSRKLANFMRMYGGAEVEFTLSPTSSIWLLEYAYDVGDQQVVDFNLFSARGNARFNLLANAVLGMETIFLKRIGFYVEVKSGLGTQFIINEKAFPLARIGYGAGLTYYLRDYDGRRRR